MEILRQPGKLYLTDEAGHMTAEVLFPASDGDTVNITHTFVDESLRGQGIAGKLMEALAAQLRTEHKKARPFCSYAEAWFERHPEYADILASLR